MRDFDGTTRGGLHDCVNQAGENSSGHSTAVSLLLLWTPHVGARSLCLCVATLDLSPPGNTTPVHRRASTAAVRGRFERARKHRRGLPVLQQPASPDAATARPGGLSQPREAAHATGTVARRQHAASHGPVFLTSASSRRRKRYSTKRGAKPRLKRKNVRCSRTSQGSTSGVDPAPPSA